MKLRKACMAWCIAGLVLAVSAVTWADDFTNFRPTGYVSDRAGILNAQTKNQLEILCTELEQETGAQMAIVTVKSLDGNSIEQYSADLYKQLGIGSKKDNRGVLLLIAPNDRKYRAEVGYGLEPVINDARAGDAGRLMVPYFRQGDYSSGVTAAAWKLAKYVADDKGVTLSGMPNVRQAPPAENHDGLPSGFWILLVLAFLFFRILRAAMGGTFGRRGGGTGSGWLAGMIIGSMIGGRRGGGWGGSGGGWSSGGGGWGGGGGGFGGFGGGMSGGGGASGGW